jgi:Putative transposase of IS4/5 family (DUF4096)
MRSRHKRLPRPRVSATSQNPPDSVLLVECDSNFVKELAQTCYGIEFERKVIRTLLPKKTREVPRVDDRRVLNGTFWVSRSGSPWADVPERYGRKRRSVGNIDRR